MDRPRPRAPAGTSPPPTETLTWLKDSRRFNTRALGTIDVEPILSSGLDTLEHCLLAIRALFTVMQAEMPASAEPEDPYGGELRAAFAVVLHDTADCLRAFGSLVVAEAEGREEETEQALAESLDILRETQAILTELIMVDARENTSSWLLRGLDPGRRRAAPVPARPGGPRPGPPALEAGAGATVRWPSCRRVVESVLPHPDRPGPRGLQPDRLKRKPAGEEPAPPTTADR